MSKKKLFIILSFLLIPVFLFIKNVQPASAVSVSTRRFDLYYAPDGPNTYTWNNNMLYGAETGGTQNVNFVQVSNGSGYARAYQWYSSTVNTTGNYASVHFETNIVATSVNYLWVGDFVNLDYLKVGACSGSGAFSNVEVLDSTISTAVTPWGTDNKNKTLTIYGDVALRNIQSNSSGDFFCFIGGGQYAFFSTASHFSTTYQNRIWFEQNPASISYTNNMSDALIQIQINQNNEYYSRTYQAEDNISNQSSSDINGASNNVTTNLLGIIQSFVTELGTLQATNCLLDMPFPSFMGGTMTVNVCQGRDILGNFVAVISSVALIGFYIPLAFVLIRMIYNEIRSWTNG